MIRQLLGTLYLLICLSFSLQAQKVTVSGYLSDAETGEPLIAATVVDTLTMKGNAANSYGFYSLTLNPGRVVLQFSYIGYQTQYVELNLTENQTLPIRLTPSTMLSEVTVTGHRSELGVRGSQMSAIEVPIAQLKAVPSLLGENDIIKALQLLPGVQSGSEGSAGLYVRGGGPDQNLLLLDGVPLYNVNHMFGFFSVFNSDALKNVTLYKGSFPARFGGRLSSVVDVSMKDGDDKKVKGSATIGLISSKIQVEGPIIKERTTFNVSARRTYIDLLARPAIRYFSEQENEGQKTIAGYYFYDINAKFTHKISDTDKLFLSLYGGSDQAYLRMNTTNKKMKDVEMYDDVNFKWGWGNAVASLRWNKIINSKLFMNATASYTGYRSRLNLKSDMVESYTQWGNDEISDVVRAESAIAYNSGINDASLKLVFDYTPNPSHDVKFGANYVYHTFSPDVSAMKYKNSLPQTPAIDTIVGSNKVMAHETMLFAEDNIRLAEWVKVNVGVHASSFHVQGENYFSVQPRLGMRLLITDNLSFKAGYANMQQYIHLLTNSTVSLPTDLWVPATKRIKPMSSVQYSAGLFYSVPNVADFSVEGYYKTMDNLLEYRNGASFMGSSANWEDKVAAGKGIAYGVEFLAMRKFGKTTGWLSYTWSKSDRLFDKPGNVINNGISFPAKYDRRHDFNITVAHQFSNRFDVSGAWIYSTGNVGTLGFQTYETLSSYPHSTSYYDMLFNQPQTHIDGRNNYRYDAYHRLDLAMNFRKVTKRGNRRTWSIGAYNVYNQFNPFIIYPLFESHYDSATETYVSSNKLMQTTLFPIIPSISYTLEF